MVTWHEMVMAALSTVVMMKGAVSGTYVVWMVMRTNTEWERTTAITHNMGRCGSKGKTCGAGQ